MTSMMFLAIARHFDRLERHLAIHKIWSSFGTEDSFTAPKAGEMMIFRYKTLFSSVREALKSSECELPQGQGHKSEFMEKASAKARNCISGSNASHDVLCANFVPETSIISPKSTSGPDWQEAQSLLQSGL